MRKPIEELMISEAHTRDFSHEMNDVCNSFSTVSIREP